MVTTDLCFESQNFVTAVYTLLNSNTLEANICFRTERTLFRSIHIYIENNVYYFVFFSTNEPHKSVMHCHSPRLMSSSDYRNLLLVIGFP